MHELSVSLHFWPEHQEPVPSVSTCRDSVTNNMACNALMRAAPCAGLTSERRGPPSRQSPSSRRLAAAATPRGRQGRTRSKLIEGKASTAISLSKTTALYTDFAKMTACLNAKAPNKSFSLLVFSLSSSLTSPPSGPHSRRGLSCRRLAAAAAPPGRQGRYHSKLIERKANTTISVNSLGSLH